MRALPTASVALALGTAGCTRNVGTLVLALLTSPNADESPLPRGGDSPYTIEVRIEEPGLGSRTASTAYVPGETRIRMPEVEVGPDRVFTVTVRDERGDDHARARSLPLAIEPDDATLALYLALVGRASEANSRMTAPRCRHTATPLPDGRVLLAGGADALVPGTAVLGARAVAHAEIFDPTSGTVVSEVPDCVGGLNRSLCLICPRVGHAAGVDPAGGPILAGGDVDCRFPYPELFASGRFEQGAAKELLQAEPASFQSTRGLVVAGGLEGNEPSGRAFLATGRALRAIDGGLHVPRYGATATALPDGGGLVAGGFIDRPERCEPEPDAPTCRARGTTTGVIEMFDPDRGTFEEARGGLVIPRAYATATALPDGRVVIAGGLVNEGPTTAPTATVEVFDPGSGVSCVVGSLLQERWLHAAVAAAARPEDERVIVFAGYEGRFGNVGGNIEVLAFPAVRIHPGCEEPGAVVSRFIQPRLRYARAGHTVTRLANGAFLIAGGVGEDGEGTDVIDLFWLE